MNTNHIVSTAVAQVRIAQWIEQAKPIKQNVSWTERRLAIEIGGHTYLIQEDQIFQCAHCGHYDPKWRSIEVLKFFEETMGIKPHEIDITCTLGVPSGD